LLVDTQRYTAKKYTIASTNIHRRHDSNGTTDLHGQVELGGDLYRSLDPMVKQVMAVFPTNKNWGKWFTNIHNIDVVVWVVD